MPAVGRTESQVDRLEEALLLMIALAASSRLAVVGHVAANPTNELSVGEIATSINSSPDQVQRDMALLMEAGLLRLSATPLSSGEKADRRRYSLNGAALNAMPHRIGALASIIRAARPTVRAVADERTRTFNSFMPGGQVVRWPVVARRQRHLLELIVERFPRDARRSERDVDPVLKEGFPEDHCTLRRALIDSGLMQRRDGIYWRSEAHSAATNQAG